MFWLCYLLWGVYAMTFPGFRDFGVGGFGLISKLFTEF